MMKLIQSIRNNWQHYLLRLVTVATAVFMGVGIARNLPNSKKLKPIHDTIYVKPAISDSLLRDISVQVHEINNKLTPKKVYISPRQKQSCDTIHIDASLNLNNSER